MNTLSNKIKIIIILYEEKEQLVLIDNALWNETKQIKFYSPDINYLPEYKNNISHRSCHTSFGEFKRSI